MDEALAQEVGAGWLAAMRAGDWEAAWRQTDRAPQHLVWDGTPFTGRSVLVRCEHGLGDTLQFSRFLPLVAGQARELHVMAQPALLGLLQGAEGLGQVHDGWAGPDWPPHEMEIEVMELAYALRATPASVPQPAPALLRRARRQRGPVLAGDRRPRIGLLWAASGWDDSRSIPLEALAPLLACRDVQFFSLQQGEAAQDPALGRYAIELLSRQTGDVAAAAAAMLQMDAVVCVDGMPAHLAASLGRPTWLMLKHEADWRWGAAGTSTPWYPTMRLFRQRTTGDWASAVAQVAAALPTLRTTAPAE